MPIAWKTWSAAEIRSALSGNDSRAARAALYQIYYRQAHEYSEDLRRFALGYEETWPELAVLAVRIRLALHPPDAEEMALLEALTQHVGSRQMILTLNAEQWRYLALLSPADLMQAALTTLDTLVAASPLPPEALFFLEAALAHPAPELRQQACLVAWKCAEVGLFARVLAALLDPDQEVAASAFQLVHALARSQLAQMIARALSCEDRWTLRMVASFLPQLACEEIRVLLENAAQHPDLFVVEKASQAIARLNVARQAPDEKTHAAESIDFADLAGAIDLDHPAAENPGFCTDSAQTSLATDVPPSSAERHTASLPRLDNLEVVLTRFPSFVVAPLQETLSGPTDQQYLASIKTAFNAFLGYLNLSFIQCYLFYATRSPMIDRSVQACFREGLHGPTGVRFLHNMAMGLRQVQRNSSFYVFELVDLMARSGDDNPLLTMRELAAFLEEPESLAETLPEAREELVELLLRCRAILHNRIVMRIPSEQVATYLDLTGPTEEPLAPEKYPSIELPAGELVILSSDQTEALGLFPFFTYRDGRICFVRPEQKACEILYERLELDMTTQE